MGTASVRPIALTETDRVEFARPARSSVIPEASGPRSARTGELERARQMLDDAPINIIYADREGTVHYMNRASFATLTRLEAHLPIRADELIGRSFDVFHKNPAHQRRIVSSAANLPHTAIIPVGPERLRLLVTSVRDEGGNHIGAMLTWEVITQQLATEQALKEQQAAQEAATRELRAKVDLLLDVVSRASSGDLTAEVKDRKSVV